MYLRLLNPLFRPFTTFPLILSRPSFGCEIRVMGSGSIRSKVADFRIRSVSGYKTELLEVRADDPALHVVFIPGNPGMMMYYKDFVELLYEQMDGRVPITAVGHLSHSKEIGLGEWKVVFIARTNRPQDRFHQRGNAKYQSSYAIGQLLYRSISISNSESGVTEAVSDQEYHTSISAIVASLGLLSTETTRFMISKSVGKSWTKAAIEATCSHLLKYHTMRNVFFMAMTEFQKLKDEPNWAVIRAHRQELPFLFGIDDYWGPLQMHGEISKQVPEIALSLEREGHTHSFCFAEAGSRWVAHRVASLMKNNLLSINQPTI